jgi:hypothetical protein
VALVASAGLVVTALSVGAASAAVPTPGTTQSVITVDVGGDRSAGGIPGPLAGVVLQLLADNNGTAGAAVGQTWSTCTSDAAGDCSFVVPSTGTGGTNRDRRFWVAQVSAPAGWYTNPQVRVGSSDASTSLLANYQFRTGTQLRGGVVYRSGSDFMTDLGTGTTQRQSSGGTWQQSRTNPAFPAKCGLDVALILDLSGSVGADLPNLKSAANGFVDALVGTPSRVAAFSFSYTSPASGAGTNYPGLQPVSTVAGATTVKGRYAGWTSAGGTNWDRGIDVAANATQHYDLAIVITDGNPTNWGTRVGGNGAEGSGSNNRVREVEEAIFSANDLKSQGTRVVAMGVGSGVTDANTARNLRAISGTTAYNGTNEAFADYFQEPDYADAATALRSIALDTCEGSISVVKAIVPPDNTGQDISGAVPAPEGWTFEATGSPSVSVDPGSATTTEDGTGSVNFGLTYTGGATTGTVTINELQHTDHTLVTQGVTGDNAVCTDLNNGASVPVTNTGTLAAPGFVVEAGLQQAISCIVYNRPPPTAPDPATLTVDKVWVIDAEGTSTTYADGAQPDFLHAALSVTDPVDGTPGELGWGVVAHGYAEGDTPTLTESVAINRPMCDIVSRRVTEANGVPIDEPLAYTPTLQAGDNHYTVTNEVTCSTRLTLVKIVSSNGTTRSANPGDWTLTASGPTPVSGAGGSAVIAGQTILSGEYGLSEAGPSGYEATGWDCVGTDQIGDAEFSAQIGEDITCTLVNTATEVTRPVTATPRITTRASHKRVTPGKPFSDRVSVTAMSGATTAVARLYGPFGTRAAARCTPANLARTVSWRVANGTSSSPKVKVSEPGYYTWQVTTLANGANRAASHSCGQAPETVLVAKVAYAAPLINGGYSGTLDPQVAARGAGTRITVWGIGVDATVVNAGVRRGRMSLPGNVAEVARLGRSAGLDDKIGTTVIAGHVSDRHDRPGAMYRLSRARKGQVVTVTRNGVTQRYKIVAKASYARAKRLPQRYFTTTGKHRLVLVSCTDRVLTSGNRFHYARYQVVVAQRIR